MGKISSYARVLAAKLADVFVVDQTDNGTTETKSATVEQIGTAIGTLQTFASLNTTDKTIAGAINEVANAIPTNAGNLPLGSDFTNPTSTAGAIAGKINPPDLSNITRVALTSDLATEVISTGAWYAVRAINRDTSGTNYAYILDSANSAYLASNTNPAGTYVRAVTPWLYFPSGAKFYARCAFTSATESGLLSAPPLS